MYAHGLNPILLHRIRTYVRKTKLASFWLERCTVEVQYITAAEAYVCAVLCCVCCDDGDCANREGHDYDYVDDDDNVVVV